MRRSKLLILVYFFYLTFGQSWEQSCYSSDFSNPKFRITIDYPHYAGYPNFMPKLQYLEEKKNPLAIKIRVTENKNMLKKSSAFCIFSFFASSYFLPSGFIEQCKNQ